MLLCSTMMRKEPMKKSVCATLAALAFATTSLSFTAASANEEKSTFTRSEIETIVREYLINNPEVLLDVQTALQEKQRVAQQAAIEQIIDVASDELFHSEYDGVIGNPDGDVTVVEFFDYNCGFCKRALADMEKLVESDSNLRFVLKEFPILSEDSHKAHVVSMAVHLLDPARYTDFHRELLGSSERATEESAIKVATGLGIDEAALRETMQDPRIMQAFGTTYQLAEQLQITGTPGYVIGKEIVSGAMGEQVLREKIEAARQ